VKIHHFILFIVGFVVFGCASNRYMVADKLLEQEDYTRALKEYVGLAKVDGSLNLSRDVRGLTGAMISYYGLGKYKNSFAISKRILSLDTYNSSAIFYAGLNLEQTEKYSLAKRIYRYYEFLPQNNPYYDFIKSRFRLMVEKEMATRAKMAVQMEKSVGMGQVVDNTLAVLYFVNILEDPRWNVISKGIAEMMITDFSQVEKLTVIERVQLQKLIEEIGLGMSGMVDDSTAPRMGKLMRAKNLVHGSFSVKAGRNLIMNADVIDVKAEQNLGGNEYSGELKEILELEKKIVFNTLANLNIKISAEERARIKENTTKSLESFLEFCKGLDFYDNGNIEAALSHFQQALRHDPKFRAAQNMANMTLALNVVNSGKFVSKHRSIIKRRFALGRRAPRRAMHRFAAGQHNSRFRLQQLARNLDLGYLPGNDSRNGSAELFRDDILDQLPDWFRPRQLLPEPPKPPTLGSDNF